MGAIDYFRTPSEKDNKIFNLAKQLKTEANEIFKNFEQGDINFSKNIFHFIDSRYIPLKDSNKPDELNIYIRKIETIYRDSTDIHNIPINPMVEKIDVVEEWTKSYLPDEFIDDSTFYKYLKIIHNLRFIHSIMDKFKKNQSIIFVNLELSYRSGIKNSFSLSQLEDEIHDLQNDLYLKAEDNGWIIVESYKDYSGKDDLLQCLDTKNPQEKSYVQLFSNDFVFLNNTDNINGEVDSSLITPNIIFESLQSENNNYFCYTRNMNGADFRRNSLFIPQRFIKKGYLEAFSSLVNDIVLNKDNKDVR
jgi:hypothetical protein